MAILAIFTGNMTTAQYEALRKEVNWEGDQPMGGVFHAASFDDAGRIHVADVWESHETMNAFVERRLVPAMQKLGIAPPEVAVRPAYNINAYRAIEKHRV
jgi:hypothetical protein